MLIHMMVYMLRMRRMNMWNNCFKTMMLRAAFRWMNNRWHYTWSSIHFLYLLSFICLTLIAYEGVESHVLIKTPIFRGFLECGEYDASISVLSCFFRSPRISCIRSSTQSCTALKYGSSSSLFLNTYF